MEDSSLRGARREAALVLVLWAVALASTLLVACRSAYRREPGTLTFVLGFPDWVFWGVVLPWGASLLVTAAFALFFMRDATLEDPRR
jgi:hypothetical protein